MSKKKIIIGLMTAGLVVTPNFNGVVNVQAKTINNNAIINRIAKADDCIYLSDIDYIANQSSAGWGNIKEDVNLDDEVIKLLVEGAEMEFEKGIVAHAPSTIVYDISNYSNEFTNLSTFLGIDVKSGGKGDGVKFRIYKSNDNSNWELIKETGVLKGDINSEYVNLDISGTNYIKLEADQLGGNGSDHSLYADLKLVKADYNINAGGYEEFKNLEEYDAELSKHSVEYNYENNFNMVLRREFVNRVGYLQIQNAIKNQANVKEALDWLVADDNALELFIEAGGYLHGNGYNAITALADLYENYKDDLNDQTDGELYKRMLIATAVAFSKPIQQWIIAWGGNGIPTDPVTRYAEFKELYTSGEFLRPDEFKSLNMELLRYVVDIRTDDEEITWLREYSEERFPSDLNKRLDPYSFVEYERPNYGNPEFYSESNRQKWDDKYGFTRFGLTGYGEAGRTRPWMAMESGGICWGISGMGDALNSVHGIPTVNVFQPGHEAYLVYYTDDLGRNAWKIYNDVAGWAQSYSSWGGNKKTETRLLLGWGNKSHIPNNVNNSTYILLAQTALNDFEDCRKSQYYNMIANSYPLGSQERLDVYNKALDILDINLDSFDGIIESYKAMNKSSAEWRELAKRVIDKYMYFPAPMIDTINRIIPYLTDATDLATINTLKTNALYTAKDAQDADVIEARGCREIARFLLGESAVDLASFSFDGEYANQIRLHESYNDSVLRVRYSLDGGNTWTQTGDHVITLTDEQVNSITADNDIIVGLVGTDATFTIDIQSPKEITDSIIYKNDYENLLIGETEHLEYKLEGSNEWKDYITGLDSDTRFVGDTKVKVRYKAHDLVMKGAEKEYTFTQDTDTEQQKYLQLKNVRLHSFSSQNSDNKDHSARNLIDGTINTAWHTAYGGDDEKSYSIEFDKIRYISKLNFTPGNGANGRPKAGEIYSSLDGENWELVKTFNDLANNNQVKEIAFDDSVEARYLKIVATETYGNSEGERNKFFSGKLMEFFEDTTKKYEDSANIEYSSMRLTNQNVIATLHLPEGCTAEVTEHEFTENGSYEFKFTNSNGEEQTILAEVSWIDKVAPTAEVNFDVTKDTNGNVTATLDNISEEVVILNNNGSNSYTFEKNGEFIFMIQDRAGNLAEISAKVTWIDKEAPIVTIDYSTINPTTDKVTATVIGLKEGEYIVNNDGNNSVVFEDNGSFEFVVRDKAGNETKITATVDWIKEPVIVQPSPDTDDSENEEVSKPENDKPSKPNNNGNGHNKPAKPNNNGNANGHNKPANGNGNANGHIKPLGGNSNTTSVSGGLVLESISTSATVETPSNNNQVAVEDIPVNTQLEELPSKYDGDIMEEVREDENFNYIDMRDEDDISNKTPSLLKMILIGGGIVVAFLFILFLVFKFVFKY
ncbi:discoidin domain-containing protein [uncultured Clostridium sp.]|uniref:discoidin domain-containing protein n=1 Tax=uncultured Clostridium sp. TaxID=59620 RepID=UPI0026F3CDA4|nr:NPCBM/NEW2 domain-containing protein [uncultured Clostridium sp.]